MAKKDSQKKPHTLLRHAIVVGVLLVATIISAVFTLNAYIENSREAKRRYEALLAVDKAGGDVEKALLELRSFVYAHMNTTIGSPNGVRPPIQLNGTYERLVAAEQQRVKKAIADVYTRGQTECEKLYPNDFSGRIRVPCVEEYVIKNAVQPQPIPEDLYRFDFVSPRWSPDRAGWGIVVTALLFMAFLYQYIAYRRLKHHIHMNT